MGGESSLGDRVRLPGLRWNRQICRLLPVPLSSLETGTRYIVPVAAALWLGARKSALLKLRRSKKFFQVAFSLGALAKNATQLSGPALANFSNGVLCSIAPCRRLPVRPCRPSASVITVPLADARFRALV
jgi:hypothetical protein